MKTVATALLSAVFAIELYAGNPSAKGVNFYSVPREIELGEQLAANLARSLPIIHDEKLAAYIAKLASQLSKDIDLQFPYSFTLYDDRKPVQPLSFNYVYPGDAFEGRPVEPAAVAGGPVFVPLSLLAEAPNEAVLAFQLSHAMAHIALRHGTRQATRAELVNLAAKNLPANQAVNTPLGLRRFDRQFELDADTLATDMISAAGYDPGLVIRWVEAQQAHDGPPVSKVLSEHPTRDQSLDIIRSRAEKLPSRSYSAGTGDFENAKALANLQRP